MVFNFCSSSGVQGVFVLAFFFTGVSGGAISAVAFVVVEGPATLLSEEWDKRRFRELGCVECVGCVGCVGCVVAPALVGGRAKWAAAMAF